MTSPKLTRLAALIAGLTACFAVQAQNRNDAYVQDARGIIVRNANVGDPRIGNLCWRTGYWTPASANCECDAPLLGNACNPATPAPPPAPVAIAPAPAPAPAPAAPAPTVVAQKVTYAADAFFDFDKAVLKPDARGKLDELVAKLGGLSLEIVIAIGHTDSIGSDAYNQRLSLKRAEAVKAYLVSKGLEPNRVYAEGKGEKQPVADNRSAEGRAKNRRVEIEVVGTRQAR